VSLVYVQRTQPKMNWNCLSLTLVDLVTYIMHPWKDKERMCEAND
jgi:hypothetical protein